MANPNRVLANLPKRPFDLAEEFRSPVEAHALADALKAEGWDAKVTRRNNGSKINFSWRYSVWKRERKA